MAEIGKRIVGQQDVVDHLLIALFSRGHCLFVGVPGLAKTLLIQTLSDVLNLSFGRIQFTPDLMPSDITGSDVLEEDRTTGRRVFRFVHGPLFANVILADEVNRTPPKTQAALLQSMQEYRVSAGGSTYDLPLPFLVFATQNPIEQEGTYPLPEAQLDRFMFQIDVGYPSEDEEVRIVSQTTAAYRPALRKVLSPERILELQDVVLRVPVADHVLRHAVALCRATRPGPRGMSASTPAPVTAGAGNGQGFSDLEMVQAVCLLGGRPARLPVPDPGGQGPGGAAGALRRGHRGRAGPGAAGAGPPGGAQLPCRGRRGHPASHRRPRGRVGEAGLTGACQWQARWQARNSPRRAPGRWTRPSWPVWPACRCGPG
jgi:MoxR-like ATPase